MRIQASCESCFHDFSVGENAAGKRVRCPECGEPVRVPNSDDQDDEEDAAPVRRSKSGSQRPGKKKKKAESQNSLMIVLGVGGAAVVVVGVALFAMTRSAPTPVANQPAPVAIEAAPVAAAPQAHGQMAMTHGQPPMAHVQSNPSGMPAMQSSQPPIQHGQQAMAMAHGQQPMPTGQPVMPQGQPPTAHSQQTMASTAPGSQPANPAAAATPQKPAEPRKEYNMVDLIAKVEPSVVRIKSAGPKGEQTGSGFVVDTNGTVITNVHVIEGARKVEVEFSNGARAAVVGYRSLDQKKDIAVIKIDFSTDKLTPVPLAIALPPKGTQVMAFGAPLGLSFTSSEGIISALRPAEEMREMFGADFDGDWIQTSTPISPGNSGGPLVNHFGEVVAMNTMQVTRGQNLNFAMSSVDIINALSKAPAEVKPISPETVKSPPSSRSRSMASDETETDRGRRLLSEVAEIFLLNATSHKMLALDPTGRIWDKVIARSKAAVEKSKIELSFGEPSDDAAIMFVVVELRTSKKKTANAGTQELYITAELICKDSFPKKGESKVCKIWRDEENLGTISLESLLRGVYPRTAEENLGKFFNKFRTDCVKARQAQKADGDSDKDKSDKENAGSKKK